MDLGLAIKVRRTELRMKQEDLADKAGVSLSYISLLENNKRTASFDVIQKIAEVLLIKTSELIHKAEDYWS
jgi:transcriptional regulator with XRE-family HTH domain